MLGLLRAGVLQLLAVVHYQVVASLELGCISNVRAELHSREWWMLQQAVDTCVNAQSSAQMELCMCARLPLTQNHPLLLY